MLACQCVLQLWMPTQSYYEWSKLFPINEGQPLIRFPDETDIAIVVANHHPAFGPGVLTVTCFKRLILAIAYEYHPAVGLVVLNSVPRVDFFAGNVMKFRVHRISLVAEHLTLHVAAGNRKGQLQREKVFAS